MPNSVKVFISYSYDSKDHKDRILALSDQLRYDGIDCWIDQFENNAPEIGWSQWMLKKINESHFILIICTEFYLKQFSISTKLNEEDLNQNWKGPILDQKSTRSQIKNKKFIPMALLSNESIQRISNEGFKVTYEKLILLSSGGLGARLSDKLCKWP